MTVASTDPIFVFDFSQAAAIHYTDLFRVIAAANFVCVDMQQVDFDDATATYIVLLFSGGLVEKLYASSRKARIIAWMLETPKQHSLFSYLENNGYVERPFLALIQEVWVSDAAHAALNPRRFKHIFMGGAPNLAPSTQEHEPRAPTVHLLGHWWGDRRSEFLKLATAQGIAVEQTNLFGAPASVCLNQSLILIHVAMGECQYSAPIRAMMAASHKMLFISEQVLDHAPLVTGVHFEMAPFEGLVDKVKEVIDWPREKQDVMRYNMYRLFCEEHPFRQNVLEALK